MRDIRALPARFPDDLLQGVGESHPPAKVWEVNGKQRRLDKFGTGWKNAGDGAITVSCPLEAGYRSLPFPDPRSQSVRAKAERLLADRGDRYVVEGRMKYRVGVAEHQLGPGDSLYFSAVDEHDLEPLSARVVFLGIFQAIENAHVREKEEA